MTRLDIAQYRLANQRISVTTFTQPGDVVRWMGAIQAQDYAAAKWAVALRAHGLTDARLDQALADGTVLRTHVMRPTWHFVAPEDIRWLLMLTAPRVHAVNAHMYRQVELDPATFRRSHAVLVEALRNGQQLTRTELASAFRKANINAQGLRLVYLLMHAELEGVICSGGRRGKQFTYALLDERVPARKTLDRNDALEEFTRRYFTSHGPATEEDFMWWSGLSRADVQSGIEMVKHQLANDTIEAKTYWYVETMAPVKRSSQTAYLLPFLDEYVIGYTDRSAFLDSTPTDRLDSRDSPVAQYTIVVNGQIAGTWKRTLKKDCVAIEIKALTRWSQAEDRAIASAAQQYGEFLELPLVLV